MGRVVSVTAQRGHSGVSPADERGANALLLLGRVLRASSVIAQPQHDLAELLRGRQPLERRARSPSGKTASTGGIERALARAPPTTASNSRRSPSSIRGSSTDSRTAAARPSHHRPRRRAARHEPAALAERAERRSHVASPTSSTTTSTPRLPVRSRIALRDVGRA